MGDCRIEVFDFVGQLTGRSGACDDIDIDRAGLLLLSTFCSSSMAQTHDTCCFGFLRTDFPCPVIDCFMIADCRSRNIILFSWSKRTVLRKYRVGWFTPSKFRVKNQKEAWVNHVITPVDHRLETQQLGETSKSETSVQFFVFSFNCLQSALKMCYTWYQQVEASARESL